MCFLSLTLFSFCIVLQKSPQEVDQRSADMWSYAILLWELVTREVPFADLSPMEIGMKVCVKAIYDVSGVLVKIFCSIYRDLVQPFRFPLKTLCFFVNSIFGGRCN
jgi:hypothetical protein